MYVFILVEGYLKLAKDQYNYNIDQALGMLYYHSYDVTKSLADLPNFCPLQGKEREREGKVQRKEMEWVRKEGRRERGTCSRLFFSNPISTL